jgi:hypothetical protein
VVPEPEPEPDPTLSKSSTKERIAELPALQGGSWGSPVQQLTPSLFGLAKSVTATNRAFSGTTMSSKSLDPDEYWVVVVDEVSLRDAPGVRCSSLPSFHPWFD